MRSRPAAAALILFASLAAPLHLGAEVEKFYYLGDLKSTSETGQPLGGSVLLLEKTHDPDHSLIIERAIEIKPDHTVAQYVMNMKVSGSSFTLSDDKNTVHGSGTLFGPAWKWTYFKASFQAENGVRIEDENFMADPSVGVARKKIVGPNGKVLMFMDITLKAVTKQTFEALAAALLKNQPEVHHDR